MLDRLVPGEVSKAIRSAVALPMVFIRHGETDWNAALRLQGQTDIPLNDKGRGQARRNGQTLKTHLEDRGIAPSAFRFFASPMARARETMQIVAGELGIDPAAISYDDRLKEITFGTWEGFSMAEIETTRPQEFEPRRADPFNHRPPGGESYADLMARTAHWLAAIDGPAVIVSHGAVSRVFRAILQRIPVEELMELSVPQKRFFAWDGQEGRWI
ncbi:2,3-bisphosphoglycerate-dependent phosphoglycerate mutase [Hartmannibacter diazotrophicus]|uniref:2,3-bisphosphoglycerate-dependent phosphoglycerate mutase n=1 Tax=Hartmannibacter diazotrophicus TaxID=1482074 RepID=A0A2C9D358_9HYPH|nr:histidine phosphatase family protein [Hartmannibacter diazotrophicus]SON54742.1 2,3-bisphosphoglycerate-dependent phosphoglycerate mutase [Hartmannibacter diazotrophicus]